MSLPSGYTRLEYIQSSGAQYIDTGIAPGSLLRVECDVEAAPAAAAAWFFGARHGNTDRTYNVLTYDNKYRSDFNNSTDEYSAVTPSGRFVIDKNRNVTSFGGVTGVTAAYGAFQCSYNLYLFANNNAGTAAGFGSFKLYSAKIYNNDTLVRDFIPCRNASGAVGLWDEVSGAFFANAGTGSFTAGPEVRGSHKTLIGGTAYDITGGRALIAGTGYGIVKGRTLIGGTGYDITLPGTGTPLSGVTTGSTVLVRENGSAVEFYVAQHDYESALNGAGRTLLVRKDCYDTRAWHNSDSNAYSGSSIDYWLNRDYINMFDAATLEAAAGTKFKYTISGINSVVSTLERTFFLLSLTELGKSGGNTEGSALGIANMLQIAYRNGTAAAQWTRTPNPGSSTSVYMLLANGGSYIDYCFSTSGCRPAFTMPGTTLVDEDGTIIV